MDKQHLLGTCAERLLEVVPLLRSNINAYIHSEVDRTQWVTPGQTRLLYLISQGAASISDLVSRQKTSAPTISRQVDALVEKGLVSRARQHHDRRLVALSLTPRGEEILNGIMETTRDWIARNLDVLNTSQLDDLVTSLELLRKIFKSEEE